MQRLRVISFGKLKTPGLRASADHFLKMLSGFAQVSELELKPRALTGKSPAERKKNQFEEEELLLRCVTPRSRLVLLDERGKSMSTEDWAKMLREFESDGRDHETVFAVGSTFGFSDALRAKAKTLVSLGSQTLAHELARVVLLEQLYRASSLNRGHSYHVAN